MQLITPKDGLALRQPAEKTLDVVRTHHLDVHPPGFRDKVRFRSYFFHRLGAVRTCDQSEVPLVRILLLAVSMSDAQSRGLASGAEVGATSLCLYSGIFLTGMD